MSFIEKLKWFKIIYWFLFNFCSIHHSINIYHIKIVLIKEQILSFLLMQNISIKSIVSREAMQTFLALIKYSRSFVCASCLHCVIFKFRMFAYWAGLLYCHFCFSSSLLGWFRMHVLPHPVFLFMDRHMAFYRFAYELFKAKLLFARWARNLLEQTV